ncbi:MAG: LD-carboxypeptidase [Bacteroidota bacterium]
MQSPSSLREGNRIKIISTARKISHEELVPAITLLKSWGLEVELGKHLFDEYNQFAGEDEKRAADFQEALDNPDIKAVLFARGGYGTVRIIDKIDFSKFKKNPKWLCGYSDITVIHNHVHRLDIETLHSTMPINFKDNSVLSLNSLKQVLFGEKLHISADHFHLNRNGSANGEVVGGNLSILYSLTGTNSDLDTNGKILFIEDLDEYLYHIDRMMQNLLKSGKLANLKGLIVGGMTEMNDNSIPYGKTASEIISETVSEFHFPVCYIFPAGHQKDNRCLILGRQANFIVDEQGASLSF